MPRCFIIQPFDNGPFDKRYKDVIKPAVATAGFEAYRVDRGPGVVIPIETITSEISNSAVCIADITLDNPNVWFELGFALARGRNVIMICDHSARGHFPFDIQHRSVLRYRTESSSDFEALRESLAKRLKQYSTAEPEIQHAVAASSIRSKSGLQPWEIAILVFLLENRLAPTDGETGISIRESVNSAGFTKAAVALGLERLRSEAYVRIEQSDDGFGNAYSVFCLEPKGLQWLLDNIDQLVLTEEARPGRKSEAEYDPFADE